MPVRTSAIVTASYAGDLERCRLLCETVDRHVTGYARHYLLVAGHDRALFRPFETQRRVVVDERDLLPRWLHAVRDPLSLFSRHVWLSLRTKPLRGWHVQQLRRIAIADHIGEDAILSCDSDVVFLRPFDCASLWHDGDLRFLRRPGELDRPELTEQRLWSRNAARALGLPEDPPSRTDYISTAIAWRRDCAVMMRRRIEAVHDRHWIEAVAASRSFSECMIYGRFVDDVLRGRMHFATGTSLCRTYWGGPRLDPEALARFASELGPDQVAIGLQSFVGTGIADIRRLVEAA
jgi:hypothetical protein